VICNPTLTQVCVT